MTGNAQILEALNVMAKLMELPRSEFDAEYAEFKRRTGLPEAVAARCGDINDRIAFVLKTFGVTAPEASDLGTRRSRFDIPLRCVPVPRGTTGVQCCCGRLELCDGPFLLSGRCECPTCERA